MRRSSFLVTINRASSHNALNKALCTELRDTWLRFCYGDDRVAVVAATSISLDRDQRNFIHETVGEDEIAFARD